MIAEQMLFKGFKDKAGRIFDFDIFRYIFQDRNGHIWVCVDNMLIKLPLLDKDDKIDDIMATAVLDTVALDKVENRTTAVLEFEAGELWVATKNSGVVILDKDLNVIRQLRRGSNDGFSLSGNDIRSLLRDNNGNVWISTGTGLSLYDGTKIHSFYATGQRDELSNNSVRPIFQDSRGSIWIGTYYGGVNIVDHTAPAFKNYSYDPYRNSLSFNVVSQFLEDKDRNLIIGTEGGGINLFDVKTGVFNTLKHESGNATLSSNNVKSMCLTKNGDLWVGTFQAGLNVRKKGQNTFQNFKHDRAGGHSLVNDNVYALLEDRQGDLWIGTLGGGLQVWRKKQEAQSEVYNVANGRLSSDLIRTVFEDSQGNLWVGSQWGLYLKRRNTTHFEAFFHEAHDKGSISGNDIACIYEDNTGRLWVGTNMRGLNIYNPTDNSFTHLDQSDGLAGNSIFGILDDDHERMWISTNGGLSCMNMRTGEVRNYNHFDGLVGNEFTPGAALKLFDGRMAFGSFSGFTIFHPDSMVVSTFVPPVVFTSLKVFNKEFTYQGTKDISDLSEISLKHDQNIFSLEFSVLNYINPDKNQFAYLLKGFDKDWNYVDNPLATYTNLKPGDYELWIKGTNNDGLWVKEPTVLKIKIVPAPWKTWWAYMAYMLIGLIVIYFILRFIRDRNRLKNKLYLEQLAFEKQKEVQEERLNFFSNVSHEIRTPLSLIVGPLDRIKNNFELPEGARKLLFTAHSNVTRLTDLVNQLLYLRTQEQDVGDVRFANISISNFIHKVLREFEFSFEEKNIKLVFVDDLPRDFQVTADPDKLEKIIGNLLSNALKFTGKGGEVRIDIHRESNDEGNEKYIILVSDTGTGITKEDIPHIFERFYKAAPKGEIFPGFGIGLALVKSLVEIHGGEITVDSDLQKFGNRYNTMFKITMPLGLDHATIEQSNEWEKPQHTSEAEHSLAEPPLDEVDNKDGRPVLLIVEDNIELQDFIADSLRNKYDVLTANNGDTAWEIVKEEAPDIVISDIMMPISDGIDLLQKIKSDKNTNHIPVILLTALTAEPHVINAFREGTDDYITKPFNIDILMVKINNIFKTRKLLEEKFTRDYLLEPQKNEAVAVNSLLQKAIDIVETHIEDELFGVNDLAERMGMSRSVLYRKVKQTSGLSIVEFINVIRLKKAAQILKADKSINVAELAYKVGFTDPKYFSKQFKKYFKKSPSKFS
jgi:signal transduction histidine kinase/ligand-binding sensor domain-containing protein/AraC-like DNA-binding protein